MRMPRPPNHAFVFCVFALCLERAFCDNTEEIKRLRKDLLHSGKYQRTVKPQGDVNGTTVVSLELKPVSVPTLTPKRHHLFMNAFVCLSWMDKRLTWVTDKYGGLESIFVNSSEMWTPSVIHLSPLDVRGPRDALASLNSAGEVSWCPLYSIGAVCETDMSDFPFDRHGCNIVFTNAMSQEKDINLTLARQPELLEQQRSEFRVLSMKATRTSLDFDLGRYVYPQIIFRVLLERRTSLHLFTVLVPTVAVVLLSLLVFWIPPESPRKLTLIGAAMLTSLLLLYRAEDVVSGSSGVPKIVKVLGGAVLLNSLIAATTVLSINMARRPPSFTLPVALVRCTEFLAFRVPCPCPGGQTGAEDDGGVQNKSFSNAVAREWYTAARALDRVLGLVFSAAFVVLCL
ncbi:acetylcholine receptor subunit gamma-like [Amblyomma americanum]